MSLDTIKSSDVPRGRVYHAKDEDLSLKTGDIKRCAPTYPWMKYLEKPSYAVGITPTDDYAGGQAKSYYPPMDRRPRDLSLTTADIEYAQPKNVKFRGNRHSDPVQPFYKMSACDVRAVTPVRSSGRETNDISDIDMAQPRKVIPDRNYDRDPNDGSDIEFASPNYRRRVVRPVDPENFSSSLHVRDITEDGKKTQVRMPTHPLDPQYTIPTTATTSLNCRWEEERTAGLPMPATVAGTIGPVAGSKPRKLTWDNQEPFFSLLREDIAGAASQRWVGSTPFNIYDPPDKKPVISFHDPYDVPGSQVGTLRKGIVSTRQTNPLNPKYQMLDGTSLKHQAEPVLEAERGYVPSTLEKQPSVPGLQLSTFGGRSGTPLGAMTPVSQAGSQGGAVPPGSGTNSRRSSTHSRVIG